MKKNVINLKNEATARGKEHSQPAADEPTFDVLGRPEGVFNFSFDDFVQDHAGQPLFTSPQKLAQAKNVFARWGLDLQDYSESTDILMAAQMALQHGHTSLSLMVEHDMTAGLSAGEKAYLLAVHEGDRAKAAKLFAGSSTAQRVEFEIRIERLRLKVAKRPDRPDARQNAAVAFLLKQPMDWDARVTVEVALEGMFGQQRTTPKSMCIGVCEGFLRIHGPSSIKKLWKQGLLVATAAGCPEPDEVSVLFRWDAFQARMDRLRVKNWRELLGPFVGFDQNWRLLMPEDLEYFEAANPHVDCEWKRAPAPEEARPGLRLVTPSAGLPAKP